MYVGGLQPEYKHSYGSIPLLRRWHFCESGAVGTKGDFIHVDIDFVLNNVKVKSARGMDFIPQLVTPGRTQNLPKVSIKGRDEYLAYERELALMNAKEKRNYEKPYIVEKPEN